MNRPWNSWALLDTTAVVGQMGTSGSLPQRFSNGRKASKDNPIGHCQAELPGVQTLGWGGWVSSMGAEEGEWQNSQLCILAFLAYNPGSM